MDKTFARTPCIFRQQHALEFRDLVRNIRQQVPEHCVSDLKGS